MIYVEVWHLSGPNAADSRIGVLGWDGANWVVDPVGSPAANLLKNYTPGMDPISFLAGLREYNNSYMRITPLMQTPRAHASPGITSPSFGIG